MFVETALQTIRENGWAAQIVPEGLYNGANSMAIRQALFGQFVLHQIYGFENANEVWFTEIDTRMKFCLYVAKAGGKTEDFRTAFNIRSEERLTEVQSGAVLRMPVSLVREFSPDALAVMELGNQTDIDIAAKMYKWPKFGDVGRPPIRRYMREVDMGNDRELFVAASGVPVYEGRMVDHFDYRAKGYRSGRGRAAVWADLPFSLSSKSIQPQWYIPEEKIPTNTLDRIQRYRIGFCDVASPTNERSLVAALIPPKTICGHKVPTITYEDGFEWAYLPWLAIANSFAMDFLARKKISLTMSYTVLDSLPFPRLSLDDDRVRQLIPLALQLTCTGPEMIDFWNCMADESWVTHVSEGEQPPGLTDSERRLEAMAQIEVIVARDLFGLTQDEVGYILDTFPIVRDKDIAVHGTYRTKDTILRLYREYAQVPVAKPKVDINRMSMIVVLLLQAAKQAAKPATRDDLTLGLALFFNDAARKTVLRQPLSTGEQRQLDDLPQYVRGLNEVLARQLAQELIREHEGLFLPGSTAPPFNQAPQPDRELVQEVVQAVSNLSVSEKSRWSAKVHAHNSVSG